MLRLKIRRAWLRWRCLWHQRKMASFRGTGEGRAVCREMVVLMAIQFQLFAIETSMATVAMGHFSKVATPLEGEAGSMSIPDDRLPMEVLIFWCLVGALMWVGIIKVANWLVML